VSAWQRVQYYALSFLVAVCAVFYLTWWFNPARLNANHPLFMSIPLFVALTFVTMHRPFIETYGWVVLRKVQPITDPPPPQLGLRAALITTYVPKNESFAMVKRTLRAMLAADYIHDTWLLDEGASAAARTWCEKHGVLYFTRCDVAKWNTDGSTFAKKTKGGNHNAWYDFVGHTYQFVAQFDSDFLVRRDVLTGTLGYFRNPRVGWVGTPQIYGNMESWVARGAAMQTFAFYGIVMRGLGDRKQGLMIGANHIVRVQALEESGWYDPHLVEDLATGLKLGAKWLGVYVPRVFAVGEGPTSWSAYFNQQYRWAFGGLEILFGRSFRILRTLPLRQALRYVWMLTFYLNGLAMAVGVTLLMLYYITGISAASMPLGSLIVHYAPLLFVRQLLLLWSQRFNVRPEEESGMLWEGRFITMAALPIYMMALFGVLRRKRMVFEVTNKGDDWQVDKNAKPEGLQVFKPHAAIAAILLGGILLSGQLHHDSVVFFLWGAATTVLMIAFSMVPSWVYNIRWAARIGWRLFISRWSTPKEITTNNPVQEVIEG